MPALEPVSRLSTVSPGERGKMKRGRGGRCLRKESPRDRQELAGRLLAAALNVSPKREFTTPRTLISAKDLVILENFTTKLLHKPRAFLAS